jgi:profilin
MSWDSYIDNLIAQSQDSTGDPNVDKACIIGLDGGAPWTTNGHPKSFKLSPQEGATIANCFKTNNFTSFQGSGVYCEGVKYQFLRTDTDGMVLAKKKDSGAVSMGASKTAIVIAHTAEGKQQGNANKAVMVIVDYLKSMNM